MFFTWGIICTIFSDQDTHFPGPILQAYVINLPDSFYKQINLSLGQTFGTNEGNLRRKELCFNRY